MKSNLSIFNTPQTEPFHLEFTTSKMDLSKAVLANGFNDLTLFIAHSGTLPHSIYAREVDCDKGNKWFVKHYESEIKDCYFTKNYHYDNRKDYEMCNSIYFLYDYLLVKFTNHCYVVSFHFKKTKIVKIEEIIEKLKKFKLKIQKVSTISLLTSERSGISKVPLKISKPKLSIRDNYNEDFIDVHQIILNRLSKKNNKGLVLLYGKPGTGKTSYIRYLISTVKKEIIFLPPNMAESITDPNLISTLIENPNSIFVIEDAENIVVDRNSDENSPVSTLLNISDGLLSDCLNIQIICSFNTELSKVDNALLRKSRLIAKYEFKELDVDKAQALSDKLGFTSKITEPSTLTSIYNQNEKEFSVVKAKSAIGFRVNGI